MKLKKIYPIYFNIIQSINRVENLILHIYYTKLLLLIIKFLGDFNGKER